MPIDFSDMLDADDAVPFHPRDIFITLNRASRFSFPRDIQTEVMNRWFDARDNRDSVIKLNVGSGKTLVGLLLLQSSLNEGKGPALYVSPDNQLSRQVLQEATELGIDATDNPRDTSYIAGERICVVNVYKLFNGRSIFGVGTRQISIGTVVIDDTHACLSTITQQFRITLRNTHEAYKKITNHEGRFIDPTTMVLFADELCADLQFGAVTASKFEAAINDLAWFIGIKGQRPERDYNEGPDNLWALPGGSFFVIECKSGVTSGECISKRDAGQLGQSV